MSLKVNHLANAKSLYSSHDRLGESCFLFGGLTCGPDRCEPKALDGREINMKDLLKSFWFSTVLRENTNHDRCICGICKEVSFAVSAVGFFFFVSPKKNTKKATRNRKQPISGGSLM